MEALDAEHVGVADDRHEQARGHRHGHSEVDMLVLPDRTPSVEALSMGNSPSAWTTATWTKSVTLILEPAAFSSAR